MEEMVQVLFEDGVLVAQRNGKARQAAERGEDSRRRCRRFWPRASTGCRPAEKELLQTLAVIGREFALSLVRRVVDAKNG